MDETIQIRNPLRKRLFDIFVASTALLVASPLMLFAAVLIVLDERCNPIFTQLRTGLGGHPFKIYKFRTMTESGKGKYLSLTMPEAHLRITSLGKILRNSFVDELPQLFNVLLGNMSIVGPRPVITDCLTLYGSQIPDYSKRLEMKPGMTGLVQILPLRYELDSVEKYTEWTRYDSLYVRHWSMRLDLWVCWKTIQFVVNPKTMIDQERYFSALRAKGDLEKQENTLKAFTAEARE